jgi:hypothetical protein
MANPILSRPAAPAGSIAVRAYDSGSNLALENASISVWQLQTTPATGGRQRGGGAPLPTGVVARGRTGADGRLRLDGVPIGTYAVTLDHGLPDENGERIAAVVTDVAAGAVATVEFAAGLGVTPTTTFEGDTGNGVVCVREGDCYHVKIAFTAPAGNLGAIELVLPPGARRDRNDPYAYTAMLDHAGTVESRWELRFPLQPFYAQAAAAAVGDGGAARLRGVERYEAMPRMPVPVTGSVGVSLARAATAFTDDLALWRAIVNSTDALSFNNYQRFMDRLFCGDDECADGTLSDSVSSAAFRAKVDRFGQLRQRRFLPYGDAEAYRVVKAATEAFVMVHCGTLTRPGFDNRRDALYLAQRDLPLPPDGGLAAAFGDYLVDTAEGISTLPYLAVIRAKLPDVAIKFSSLDLAPEQVSACQGILREKLVNPCLLELIWSYWHEEGMLVQTMNAIARRFQNVRAPGDRDPLAHLEIDPLRSLNNVLWGFVQDEQHRLSVQRRDAEYRHLYGLPLQGRAVRRIAAADTRSRFLEGFHNLLRACCVFFRQDDDTTVKADAFPVLNALKEVHLILSQGAHNQFGDLPSTARVEMLLQQWMLARPEFREFLPTRVMTAYPEPWMDRVDAMKRLQGWSDTSSLHFRNLAVFGEQVLLAVRWGHWSDVNDPLQAFNWVRFFRPQIQGYCHAYRAVTGVDLAAGDGGDSRVDATPPSVLLQRRLYSQQRVM